MMNPMLMEAQKKSPEQLQADMFAAHDSLRRKMMDEAEERQRLAAEGWVTIPVPVGDEVIDAVGVGENGERELTPSVTRTRYVNAYCRFKSKGDPSTMEFRLPLHPEVAAQYEVRNIPALNLIRREQVSRNLDDVFVYIDQYAKLKYEEGMAIAKGYHADAQNCAGQAEMVMADIRYIVMGDPGE